MKTTLLKIWAKLYGAHEVPPETLYLTFKKNQDNTVVSDIARLTSEYPRQVAIYKLEKTVTLTFPPVFNDVKR